MRKRKEEHDAEPSAAPSAAEARGNKASIRDVRRGLFRSDAAMPAAYRRRQVAPSLETAYLA